MSVGTLRRHWNRRCVSISTVCFLAVCFLSVWAALAAGSAAQSRGGRVRGTIIDQSGGAVTGAKVTLVNQANGTQRATEAGATGEYVFLEVPVGTYQIEVAQQGFKKFLRKNIVLELNQILTLDIPLQLGGSTEVVEVTRSEEHTSELQSPCNLVCRLL